MNGFAQVTESAVELSRRCVAYAWVQAQGMFRSQKGQGTTEYAILVGVLVVIAIIAIVAFRPKLQELWTAIQEGINSL